MTDSNQKTKNKIILFFILIVILMGVSLFVILKINDNSINIDNQDFDTVEEEIDTDDEEIDSEDSGILDNEQIQMDVNKNKISYSGLQVAQNIELFLNSLNQQNGEYYFKKGCDDDTTGPVHIQNNNWAKMAYSGLYESNKNKEYEQKLLENWDLSAEDDSAGDLYTSMQLYELYKLSQKYPNLLTVNDRKGLFRIINSVGSSLISAYVPRNDFAMIIATLSRASFLSSELNNELKFDMSPEVFQNADKLLDMAIERNSNENIILEKNNIKLREGQCWIELAKLKKFEMTNEVSILNESESFFNKLDLSSEFMNPKILDTSIPMNLLPCVEILLILDEKTGNKEYLDDARAILNAYLKYNWDIPQRQFCQGDYGILSKRLINTNPEGRKLMTDNAYFVYLFTQKGIKDYEFGWLK